MLAADLSPTASCAHMRNARARGPSTPIRIRLGRGVNEAFTAPFRALSTPIPVSRGNNGFTRPLRALKRFLLRSSETPGHHACASVMRVHDARERIAGASP